jgi:multicomponent Na+:H+ antiporter subunit G
MNLVDLLTVIATSMGLFFFFAGTLGVLRFPDVFSRLHALTKADNLGLGFIALGLIPQVSAIDAVQLTLTWVLVMIAGAVSSFLIANFSLARLPQQISANTELRLGLALEVKNDA